MNIVVKEKKSKALRVFATGLIMLFASACLLYMGFTGEGLLYQLIGTIAVAFFGICFILQTVRLLHPIPLLVIGEDGIKDTSSANAAGEIGYKDIEAFKLVTTVGESHIAIRLKDPEAFLAGKPKIVASQARANIKAGKSPFSIRLSTAEEYTEQEIQKILTGALDAYREKKAGDGDEH